MSRSLLLRDFAGKTFFGEAKPLSVRDRSQRLLGVSLVCLVWAGLLLSRLYSLQISDFETWQDWAVKEHFKEVVVASERGSILDRNGRLLAASVPAGSIYVRPRQVKDVEAASTKMGLILGIDKKILLEKLKRKEPFVWIKRQIPRALADKVQELDLAGVGSVMEAKRYYPYNQAASALIGMVGVDGSGLSGIEGRFEKTLHREELRTTMIRDAAGKMIEAHPNLAGNFSLPKGSQLKLTIDATLQMMVDEELELAKQSAKAKSAMAVMIDSDSGDILALSQAPAQNFNEDRSFSKQDLKNIVVETVFEPGSIMKPIVVAGAIDHRLLRPSDMINCENGRYAFASHTVKDVHPSGIISLSDVVVRSSNIGMTKVGIRLGAHALHDHLKLFGFGSGSQLNLAGESAGILRPFSEWAKIDVATHAYGQGVAVTQLQMVRAFAALANGGKLPTLRILSDDSEISLKRVINENAATQVREMLYGVVEDPHGTGKLARIDGVRVGGKTGTAQKAREGGRGYAAGAYLASFVGFADATGIGIDKKLTLMVSVDEPRGDSIYGGAVAAPVFKRIMQRSLHILANQNGANQVPAGKLEVKVTGAGGDNISAEDHSGSLPDDRV